MHVRVNVSILHCVTLVWLVGMIPIITPACAIVFKSTLIPINYITLKRVDFYNQLQPLKLDNEYMNIYSNMHILYGGTKKTSELLGFPFKYFMLPTVWAQNTKQTVKNF